MYYLIDSRGFYLTNLYNKFWFVDSKEVAYIFDNLEAAQRFAWHFNVYDAQIISL